MTDPERPLPVRFGAKQDELLTSWLVRIARANALKVQELATLLSGGRPNSLWDQCLDNHVPAAVARRIGLLTVRTAADIECRVLSRWMPRLATHDVKPGTRLRWMLPYDSIGRRPIRPWVQCCLECLRSDATPYYRQHWRFAFLTICPVHGTALIDSCQCCSAPIAYHTLDFGRRRFDFVPPISVCGACGRELRFESPAEEFLPRRSRAFEAALLQAARRGWTKVARHGIVHSSLVFEVLHRLLRVLQSEPRVQLLVDEAHRHLGIAKTIDPPRTARTAFEERSISDRRSLIATAGWLLREWPARLPRLANWHGLSAATFRGGRRRLPYWFESVMELEASRAWYGTNRDEAFAIREWLVRCGIKPSDAAVRYWIGRFPGGQRSGWFRTHGPISIQRPLFPALEPSPSDFERAHIVGNLVRLLRRYVLRLSEGQRQHRRYPRRRPAALTLF